MKKSLTLSCLSLALMSALPAMAGTWGAPVQIASQVVAPAYVPTYTASFNATATASVSGSCTVNQVFRFHTKDPVPRPVVTYWGVRIFEQVCQ